jgi:phosphoribosylglycinamide formyltransferase 1
LRVAVLVSGAGTNLQALLDAGFPIEVAWVGCNRSAAPAIARAQASGVQVCVVDREAVPRRAERQQRLLEAVRRAEPELVVLAGFDEILIPQFVAEFAGRMLNTHPSLLPAFGGTLHAVEQALAHGVKVTGCTVHLVTDDLDGGPILLQRCVPVYPDDDVATLHGRIRAEEHKALCEAVRAFGEGRVRVQGHKAYIAVSS